MPHGPVLFITLNVMDDDVESCSGGREHWISDKEDHELSLRLPLQKEALDELAPAELEVLHAVWRQFGAMDTWEIRAWIHRHCAEWHNPHDSSLPIPLERLAGAVAYDEAAAPELAVQLQEDQESDRLFASL